MYRFIALIDDVEQQSAEDSAAAEIVLREAGLQHRLTVGQLRLYASKATPVLEITGVGIVVGHLFSRDFSPVERTARIPQHASPAGVHKYLLDNYWGEYLLLQPPVDSTQALTVLRDPSGGMPCLYAFANHAGFLTSDISLATRLNRYHKRIDWDFIAHSLTYPYLKTQRTGLCHIRELLPGCALTLGPTGVAIEQAWSPWDFVTADQRHTDRHEAAAAVRATVMSVVKTWAETDGSLLLELSGGLDSAIVAAALRGARARVTCCTLTTPVPGADERQYARPMADYLGVDLQVEELRFDSARFDFEPPTATATPCLGGLQYSAGTAMAEIGASHGATSNFSGGGGDTVFCYLISAAPAADAFTERGAAAGIRAIHDLSTLHQCTFWKTSRLVLKKLTRSQNAFCEKERSLLNPSRVAETANRHPWFDVPPSAYPGDCERIFDLSGTQTFRDGAPRGTDRWMRMPLLSQPVIEACLRVPTWMWVAGGRNRAIARAAFANVLPGEVLNRRSKGTFMSYSGALYQRNKRAMRDFLLSGLLRQQQMLDADALDRFIEQRQAPRDRSFMRVLELCTVENWLRHQV